MTLPKFQVGDIVRDSHGDQGRVISVEPYREDAFLVRFVRNEGNNGVVGTVDWALKLVERKVFPGCVTITCPECAAVWPIKRADGTPETPLELAAQAYVFGQPGARAALVAAAKEIK